MAVQNPRTEQEQSVSANLGQLLRFDPNDLIRADLGPWGFAVVKDEINGSFDLIKRLNTADRTPLAAKVLEEMASALASCRGAFEMLMSVDHSAPNPGERQTQLIEKMRAVYDRLFSAVAPYLPYLEQDLTSFERSRTELQSDLSKALEDLNQKRLAADRALDAVQKTATMAGMVKEAEHFKKQADEHVKAARMWAAATVVLLLVTAGLAAYSVSLILNGNVAKLDTTYGVQLAIGKLLLFSVLFTAIVGSTRSYRSNRHNYVVNKHRENALGTFQAFVQGASHDPAVKNAVLLQATTCVFSPQPTAYGTREADAAASLPLVEMVVKAIAGEKK